MGGNLDERTENAADEAESHPTKASKASQRDSGDKSTEVELERSTWSHKATQGGGHAPSPSPSEDSNIKTR